MKATDIVRKIDDLGRIVLPKELRNTMNLSTFDPIEIFVEEDMIVLKKYKPSGGVCMVTGDVLQKENSVELFDGKITLSKDGANLLVNELIKEIEKNSF